MVLWKGLVPSAAPSRAKESAPPSPVGSCSRRDAPDGQGLSVNVGERTTSSNELVKPSEDRSPGGHSSEPEQANRKLRLKRTRVANGIRRNLVGVVGARGEGDLFKLATAANREPFGQIDMSDLRTQALFAGDDDDDDDGSGSDGGDDDGDGDEDNDEEDEEGENATEDKLLGLAKVAVIPRSAAQNTDDVMWLIEQHWGMQRPGALFGLSGGMVETLPLANV